MEGFSGHLRTIVCSSMAACMTAQTLVCPVLRAERTMPRVTPFHVCSSKAARLGSELQPARIWHSHGPLHALVAAPAAARRRAQPVERSQFLMQQRSLRGGHGTLVQFLEFYLILGRKSALAEFNHDFLELAGELERHLTLVIFHNRRAGVLADVERLIKREAQGDGVVDLALRYLLAVHRERAGAALAEAGAVVFEVELDGMLAGGKLVI